MRSNLDKPLRRIFGVDMPIGEEGFFEVSIDGLATVCIRNSGPGASRRMGTGTYLRAVEGGEAVERRLDRIRSGKLRKMVSLYR